MMSCKLDLKSSFNGLSSWSARGEGLRRASSGVEFVKVASVRVRIYVAFVHMVSRFAQKALQKFRFQSCALYDV